MALASLGGLAFLSGPLAGGALGLSPSPLLSALLGGLEELADGTPSGCRIGRGRSAGVAEAPDEFGAKVRLVAPDEPHEQRPLLRLRQARDPALHALGREGLLRFRAARRRGLEEVTVDART